MGRKETHAFGRGVVMLSLFLTTVSCGQIYDHGVAEADTIVAKAVGSDAIGRRPAAHDIGLTMQIHDTSFGRTIREAVLAYPALTRQRFQIAEAQAGKDVLLGALRPQLSYGLSAGQNLLESGAGQTVDAGITVRQLIFDGAATRKQITGARINERQLNYELDVMLSSLSRQMAQSALDLWRQREHLVLATEDVTTHVDFVDRIASRAEGGVVAESDLLSAQSRLADAQARLVRTRSGLAQAEATYASLIGPVPSVARKPPMPPTIGSETARQRITTSSQMVVARLNVAAAKARWDLTKSRRFPGVFLETTGTREDIFSDDADNEVFAGFSVDHSVFTGGQQRAREREAANEFNAAKADLELVERQLLQVLEVMLANRDAAIAEAEATERSVQLNEANLAAVLDQFEIGRRTTTEILDAHQDLIAAKNRALIVSANRIEAELSILELTGDLASVFGIAFDPNSELPDVLGSDAVTDIGPIASPTAGRADVQ